MILSRRRYNKKECITFKSTKGLYGGLSNMAPNFPVYINNLLIKNVESLYQSLRFPNNPEIQFNILNQKSPISAKKYARQYIHLTRDDWDSIRFKIMKFCISIKYYYNKESFQNELLKTRNLNIVEFTYEDKIWGATDDGEFYEGTNALGRLLMQLRDDIINNNFMLQIPDIKNFKLLGQEITNSSIINNERI